MPFLLAFLLLTTNAPADRTEWMRLEAFHLVIGMPRAEALSAMAAWNPKHGKNDNEVVVDYSDDKALTLEFHKDRLRAVRFELFVMLPESRQVFEQERSYLKKSRGEPPKAGKSVVIYDNALPNVIAVINDDPKSTQGKKGLGILAVRYYDPR